MKCKYCGCENPENETKCKKCKAALIKPKKKKKEK